MTRPLNKSEEHWYLAGPFFNPAQIALIEQVESILTAAEIRCYNPRRDAGILVDPADAAQRDAIFQKNLEGLNDCTHMLAILDYRMVTPPHSPIPDTGTVWEMGYFFPSPTVGFYSEPPKQPNLMLTESAAGLLYGLDELAAFFAAETFSEREALLRYYEGGVL